MTGGFARAVMALAAHCLGASRREWAQAMEAEFRVAAADGRALSFAAGCLVTAWGELPRCARGRLALSNYAVALGLLVPMAALQLAGAVGFSSILLGDAVPHGVLLGGLSHSPLASYAQVDSAPCLLALWLLLGLGHLRLAWALVEGDWPRVVKTSAAIAATMVTMLILATTLMLDLTFVMLQLAVLGLEFMALRQAARRHAWLGYPGALENS